MTSDQLADLAAAANERGYILTAVDVSKGSARLLGVQGARREATLEITSTFLSGTLLRQILAPTDAETKR